MDILTLIKNGDLSKVIELLDSGINVNTTILPFNNSLLFYSIVYYDIDIIEELIKRGANINHMNEKGQTPLSLCILASHHYILTKLLELKVDITPLYEIYKILYSKTVLLRIAVILKNCNYNSEVTYYLIMFADKAKKGNLNFIKSEIIDKNYVPIKTWFHYLSKESCEELFNWCKPKIKVNQLFGKDINGNKTKQLLREQVCDEGLPSQIIMSFFQPKYISDLYYELSIRLS
jgi:hypothetical protein